MTTPINDQLTEYFGKTGLEYQITVNIKTHKTGTTAGLFSYICLPKTEMDKLVLDYINFHLGNK